MTHPPTNNGREDRLVPLLLALFVLLGAWARVTAAGSSASLWFDEAWRIINLLNADSLLRQAVSPPNIIDPPAFSLAIALLAKLHNTELVLRLSAIIPGVLAILLAWLAGRRLFTCRWTALLAAFLVAFTPWATIFAKELKPYSLGLLVHLLALVTILDWRRKPTARSTLGLAALMLLLLFFSPNIIFAFPGAAILLLARSPGGRGRRPAGPALIAVAAMLGGSILYYVFLLRGAIVSGSLNNLARYWHVHFCPGNTIPEMAAWFFQRYLALFEKIGFSDYAILEGAGRFLAVAYPLMALAGAASVLQRDRRRFLLFCCLFVLPLLVMVPFNLLGLWPFGPLRMNLFLVAYVIFPPLLLLDELRVRLPGADSFLPAGLAAVVLISLQFPVAFDDYARRRVVQRESGAALVHLAGAPLRHPPAPLLVNRTGHPSFRYYTKFHRTISRRYQDLGSTFQPTVLTAKASRLYTTGVLLRKCQEHPQVAVYASHIQPLDRLLFQNDFSVASHEFKGHKVRSCVLTSELAGYGDEQRPLVQSKRFAGTSDGWTNLHVSPPLPLDRTALGTLVVVNFDLAFHGAGRQIRFRFVDQDGSRDSLHRSSISSTDPSIPARFHGAVHTKIVRPLRQARMVIAARGEYDLTIENMTCFTTRPQWEQEPIAPGTFIAPADERTRVYKAVSSTTGFHRSADQSYGWTNGNAVIAFDGLAVDPERMVLMLETFGEMPYWRKRQISLSGLKVYLNGDRRATYLGPADNPVRRYYFAIPEDVREIETIRIVSNTFTASGPEDEGVGRPLGIDLRSVQFPLGTDRTAGEEADALDAAEQIESPDA